MSGRDNTATPRDLLTTADGQLQTAGYDAAFDKLVVGTARDKFRDEFFTFDTVNNWEVIQTGTNQSLSVDGTTGGARYLRIVTGIDANQETIILSRKSFKMPFKLAFCLSMSQRIVNQEVFVELVSVNSAGVVETDATFPSTNLNNALNALSWKFDAVTATSAIYLVRGYGVSELASVSTAFTVSTAATGTSPNFLPAGIWEINGDMEESVFNTRSIDSLSAIAALQKRTQYIPDSSKDYKIRIRVRNLATPPASTTDVRLHSVRLLDTTRFTVDFARYMGRGTDASDAMPVLLTGALPAGAATIGAVNIAAAQTLAAVTSANLGIPGVIADVASAALATTTTTAALTPTFGCSYEVCIPVTAATGTLPTLDVGIEESDDSGTNWFRVFDFPRITATGIYRSPKLPLTGNRVRYVQTVGGTTPSFTRAVNRLQCSDMADPVRQIVDRSIVLTTLSSNTPSLNIQNCRNAQLVVNIGAATTPPALQLEGSDDNGLTWYAIGSPLTAVASATVQTTVANVQAQLIRARVSTAGATVTAGYVTLKGF